MRYFSKCCQLAPMPPGLILPVCLFIQCIGPIYFAKQNTLGGPCYATQGLQLQPNGVSIILLWGEAQVPGLCPLVALGTPPWQGLDLWHGSSLSLCRLIPPRSPQFSKSQPRGLPEGCLFCSFLKLILLLSLFMLFSANISPKIQACSP